MTHIFNGSEIEKGKAFYGTERAQVIKQLTDNHGIGTTSPTHALNVVGDINATGSIYKNGGTAVDYVFENDYDLMSLEDLRLFIETNKHLPNLHSSKYTGGSVEIGVLPELLLEKVEEQALYIIQLQDQLNQQEIRLKALETHPPPPQQ